MSGLIKWLDDPYLVVKFQRFFGVVPNKHGADEVTRSTENKKTENLKTTGEELGNSNCVLNGSAGVHENGEGHNLQNGHVESLRLRGTSAQGEKVEQKDLKTGNTDSTAGSIAWDIVSNQERGIEDRWETDEYVIKNKPLYYIFNFGANLGNEIFYITFFPFWLWNIDSFVGRRVCIFWALFMYLGQVTKDVLKIPRPASPPVIRLEKLYALEYGMPSTHAMVGAGFPFSILLLTSERYIVCMQSNCIQKLKYP